MKKHEEKDIIKIVAKTGFSQEEIKTVINKGKKKSAMEMEIYNMRSMRGDFDKY